MSNKNLFHYHDWELLPSGERRTFDNCALKRKAYGEFLINYLNGEGDKGYVLNLNGAWGAGKTEFVRRLYTELRDRNHPVVFIDAWKTDYAKDPLMVVGCEMLEQLKHCTNGFNSLEDVEKIRAGWVKFRNFTVSATSMVGRAVLAAGSAGQSESLGGGDAIKTVAEAMKGKEAGRVAEGFLGHYREQRDAITQMRAHLQELVQAFNRNAFYHTPIYVIVDELDRCRPDYAIELLETIKHFFNVPGVVFVVATNTDELVHSIRSQYGDGFSADRYLRRFFDRQVVLPSPSIGLYVAGLDIDIPGLHEDRIVYDLPDSEGPQKEYRFQRYVELAAELYGLQLRDVDQLVVRAQACLQQVVASESAGEEKHYISLLGLLIALVIYDYDREAFKKYQLLGSAELPSPPGRSRALGHKGVDFAKVALWAMFYKKAGSGSDSITSTQVHFGALQASTDDLTDVKQMKTLLGSYVGNLNRALEGGDGKHWHWDDIRRLIEFAGFIR
ncbi:KAP family P-loop NTPase fold protein [Ferrimonas balearica]|uniref:KAP family P-loop NTPase fold protein n=1 Tax=Ferrimonas balearica TaxID=44012 RepID=UPI001C9660C1|nr:P-loop NTPase fold protein [Ferrimonas balearica]MBY6223566.1 KAP family NTPase [Ferrimonas balearica]